MREPEEPQEQENLVGEKIGSEKKIVFKNFLGQEEKG